MIPLRDNLKAGRLTPANSCLIAMNIAIFVEQVWESPGGGWMFTEFGMVPARVAASADLFQVTSLWPPFTLVTSLFLHDGLLHLAGNMLYLFIFGPAIERRFAALRYLIFYLAAGVIAGLAMVLMEPYSAVPMVGASGAIAGVLGAYFVLYPRARILTVLPLFVFVEIVEVPALLYLLLWFVFQLYEGLGSAASRHATGGGVAWWAHVGGFLFGLLAAPLIARKFVRRRGVTV